MSLITVPNISAAPKFWAKVSIGAPNACWLWLGKVAWTKCKKGMNGGYGHTTLDGESMPPKGDGMKMDWLVLSVGIGLLFLASACGQPLISITPPSSEVWKDDITRRLGALEIQKADAALVGKALQEQQRQIDELKKATPAPTK